MSPELAAVLLVAGGAVSGFVNTVAGAGSALTLPLLTLAGADMGVANGTNRLGVLAQTLVATADFHRGEVRPWRPTFTALPAVLLGAGLGAVVATHLPVDVLKRLFGVVFLALAVLTTARPHWLSPPAGHAEGDRPTVSGHLALFGAGLYGGLVQAGVGVVLLLALVRALRLDLVRATAAKTALVLVYTVATLAVFGRAGQLDWTLGAWLAAGSVIGGLVGARATLRRGAGLVRRLVQLALVAASAQALLT